MAKKYPGLDGGKKAPKGKGAPKFGQAPKGKGTSKKKGK